MPSRHLNVTFQMLKLQNAIVIQAVQIKSFQRKSYFQRQIVQSQRGKTEIILTTVHGITLTV